MDHNHPELDHDPSRRKFLATTAMAGAILGIAPLILGGTSHSQQPQKGEMEQWTSPNSGLAA